MHFVYTCSSLSGRQVAAANGRRKFTQNSKLPWESFASLRVFLDFSLLCFFVFNWNGKMENIEACSKTKSVLNVLGPIANQVKLNCVFFINFKIWLKFPTFNIRLTINFDVCYRCFIILYYRKILSQDFRCCKVLNTILLRK